MNGLPHALDFFLSPTPEDGSCPTAFAAGQGSKLAKTFNIREIGNTTISVQIPISPPSYVSLLSFRVVVLKLFA
jgi:hypothetical protein